MLAVGLGLKEQESLVLLLLLRLVQVDLLLLVLQQGGVVQPGRNAVQVDDGRVSP